MANVVAPFNPDIRKVEAARVSPPPPPKFRSAVGFVDTELMMFRMRM